MNIFGRIFLLVCCFWVETYFARRARWRRFQDGRFIVGGLFPITQGPHCDIVREEGLLLAEAFIHRVNERKNGSLSSGVAIGYDVRDTCSNPGIALKELLDILGKNDGLSWKNCSLSQRGEKCGVIAVVGPDLSRSAMVTSGVLSAYGIPQVSLNFVRLSYLKFYLNHFLVFRDFRISHAHNHSKERPP